MRKVIVTTLMSLDGYVAGAGGDIMVMPLDESFSAYNAERLRTAETLLQAVFLTVVPVVLAGPMDLFDLPWWVWLLWVLALLAYVVVVFSARRRWHSTRSGVDYPVEWNLQAGGRTFSLTPLMDDQENDTRLSSGAIYWEGAVRVHENGNQIGRGYLELTGYGKRVRL